MTFTFIFLLFYPHFLLRFLKLEDSDKNSTSLSLCGNSSPTNSTTNSSLPSEPIVYDCSNEIPNDEIPIASSSSPPNLNLIPFSSPNEKPACGIIWFFHITKTGGGSIEKSLLDISKKNGYNFVYFMQLGNATYKEQVNLFEDKWSQVSNGWKRTIKKGLKWLFVSHHLHMPTYCELTDMEKYKRLLRDIESSGCGIYSFTILRDPYSQFISSLGQRRIVPNTVKAAEMLAVNYPGVFGQLLPEFNKTRLELKKRMNMNVTYAVDCLDKFSKVWFIHELADVVEDVKDLLNISDAVELQHKHAVSNRVHKFINDDIQHQINLTLLATGHWEFYFRALKKRRNPNLNVEEEIMKVRSSLFDDLLHNGGIRMAKNITFLPRLRV